MLIIFEYFIQLQDCNSGYAHDIIQRGTEHCMRKEGIEMLNDAKMCSHPCHITNMSAELSENFQNASGNLKKDGLNHYYCVQVGESQEGEPENIGRGQNKAIEIVEKFMKKFHHRLYRGNVYKKPEKGWCFNYFFLRQQWVIHMHIILFRI